MTALQTEQATCMAMEITCNGRGAFGSKGTDPISQAMIRAVILRRGSICVSLREPALDRKSETYRFYSSVPLSTQQWRECIAEAASKLHTSFDKANISFSNEQWRPEMFKGPVGALN